MSTIPLKTRLTAVMNSWPIPINPGCESGLKQLIDQAVTNMHAAGLDSQAQKLSEAESNFQRLLAEMTLEAGRQGFSELHEPTLAAALSRICPLFPFC